MKKKINVIPYKTKVDPYGATLNIVFVKDMKRFCDDNNVDHTGQTACVYGDGPEFTACFTIGNISYAHISHESMHVVIRLFKYIGQQPIGCDECVCYLLDHIFDCVVTAANKSKIKISQL